MSQAPNLGRLRCRSKYESQQKNHKVKNCSESCASCLHLLKTSSYQFQQVNKTFLLKNSFNCESSNLIYVVICSEYKEKYVKYRKKRGCLVKQRINIYSQHINQPQYKELVVKEHLHTCGDVKFHLFPFLVFFKEINH